MDVASDLWGYLLQTRPRQLAYNFSGRVADFFHLRAQSIRFSITLQAKDDAHIYCYKALNGFLYVSTFTSSYNLYKQPFSYVDALHFVVLPIQNPLLYVLFSFPVCLYLKLCYKLEMHKLIEAACVALGKV